MIQPGQFSVILSIFGVMGDTPTERIQCGCKWDIGAGHLRAYIYIEVIRSAVQRGKMWELK